MEERKRVIKQLLDRDVVARLVSLYDYHIDGKEEYVDAIDSVFSTLYLPDDRIIIYDHVNVMVEVYDIRKRSIVAKMRSEWFPSILSNGDIVTVNGRTIYLWNTDTYKCRKEIDIPFIIEHYIVIPDNSLIITGSKTILRWHNDEFYRLRDDLYVNKIQGSYKDHVVILIRNGSAILNVITGILTNVHPGFKSTKVLASDDKLIFIEPGVIYIYKKTGEIATRFDIRHVSIILIDNMLVMSTNINTIEIIDLSSCTVIQKHQVIIKTENMGMVFLQVLPNNNIMYTTGFDSKYYIYDMTDNSVMSYNTYISSRDEIYVLSNNTLLDINSRKMVILY